MSDSNQTDSNQTESTEDVLLSIEGGIAEVTFNRPQSRNAFTFAMYNRIAEIAEEVNASKSIRAVVVTGAGDKAFAAGTDMSEFRGFSSADDALGYERQMDRVLDIYERIEVPTIAAIRGACTGGGAAIAAASDLRICDTALKFGIPIARTLGNCLSTTNLARLSALIGAARTREILLTARLIQAEEALSIGLVNEVCDDPLQRARELASQLSGHAPLTMQATKEGLRRLREHAQQADGDDLVVMCYTSEDFHEGMEAFLGKRKPEWRGS